MYAAMLFVHSLLRWFVLAAALCAVVRAFGRDYSAGRWFSRLLDLQVAIGLIVCWLSPITSSALSNMGAAMKNRVVRFWAVEHAFSMLIAVALVHIISRARAKRKRRRCSFVSARPSSRSSLGFPGRSSLTGAR